MRTVHIRDDVTVEFHYREDDDDSDRSVYVGVRVAGIGEVASFSARGTTCCGLGELYSFWIRSNSPLTLSDWVQVLLAVADDTSVSGFMLVFRAYQTRQQPEYHEWLSVLKILGAQVTRPYVNCNTGNILYPCVIRTEYMERRLKAYERRMRAAQ